MPVSLVSKLFSTKVCLLLLVLSVGLNLFHAYRLFDTAVSLDYSRMHNNYLLERCANSIDIIRYLLIGQPTDNVRVIAGEIAEQGGIVKETSGRIEINDIVIDYTNEKVCSVKYID